MVVGLVVYGASSSDKWKLHLSEKPRFGWGMWLGVAGAIICLIASIIHIHQGRPRH